MVDIDCGKVLQLQFSQDLLPVTCILSRVVDIAEKLRNVLRDSIQPQVESCREWIQRRFCLDCVDDADLHGVTLLGVEDVDADGGVDVVGDGESNVFHRVGVTTLDDIFHGEDVGSQDLAMLVFEHVDVDSLDPVLTVVEVLAVLVGIWIDKALAKTFDNFFTCFHWSNLCLSGAVASTTVW